MPRPRAYVADDDPDTRHVLLQVLRALGYDPSAFEDGLDLARAVGLTPPAVVVLDQHMLHWDGTDAVGHIRMHGEDCPAVFVTAFPDGALRRRAADLGRCEVLAKPVDVGALQKSIERLIRG